MTIEQSRDELNYYAELDDALNMINERIEYLETRTIRSTSMLRDTPSAPFNPRSLEATWADLSDAKKKAEAAQVEIEQIRQDISLRIAKMPPNEHYLLFARHVKRLTFSDISRKKRVSERTLYRQYAKALAMYADKYDSPLLTYKRLRVYSRIGAK